VLKEATTLALAGYEIQILTNAISTDLYRQDRQAIKPYPNINLRVISDFSKPTILVFTDKLLNKISKLANRYLKSETWLALGYGAGRYHKIAKNINADLYICHQELATYVGIKLIKDGFKVAFDFEDWYSEDLLPQARAERPLKLLRQVESRALNNGIFCTTTSNALAKKLAATYSCKLPDVIYNVFPTPGIDLNDQKDYSAPLNLFWFSQTIGEGRGLEQFISLSAFLKKTVHINLLGNISPTYLERLKAILPKQHRLLIHNLVEEHELPRKIAQFDIGLALELTAPLSRNYTITNKFFQYIQSGLPVIASETEGQNEAFEQFKPGYKLSQNPSEKEINDLSKWLDEPDELITARNRALEAARHYNWENESNKLVALVTEALEK
jgi:glycosyltransferase involved in cell wall biosynthesis